MNPACIPVAQWLGRLPSTVLQFWHGMLRSQQLRSQQPALHHVLGHTLQPQQQTEH
jgi:hypothetical protein